MRARKRRRLEKLARLAKEMDPAFAAKLRRIRLPIDRALLELTPTESLANRMLAKVGERSYIPKLLQGIKTRTDLHLIGRFGFEDHPDYGKLILALLDHKDPELRDEAIWASGSCKHRRIMEKLRSIVIDESCPLDMRGTAAEQLACHPLRKQAIPQLLQGAHHTNVPLRFWCVYTLGSIAQFDPQFAPVLEEFLDDKAPNEETSWWPVGLEARAYWLRSQGKDAQLEAEIKAVRSNPNATDFEIRWADCYDHSHPGEEATCKVKKNRTHWNVMSKFN